MKVQKKTINKHIEEAITVKKLSIQFSLDGFSFCILDQREQVINFSSYQFDEKITTPEELLNEIRSIFSKDTLLQQDFDTVVVIHQNNLATLVPNLVFDKEHLKEYLSLNIKTLVTDFITFDDLNGIHAKNVYVPYMNINNYLFQNFGEFEYKHHSSILIEKLLKYNTGAETKNMYVNVSQQDFDIVVFEKEQLVFSNSFSFETKEDFIYYILFTIEQLNLDPEKVSLTFLGDIEKDSEIYEITYHYIRNVHFIHNKSSFFKDENNISNHSNFILLG